MRPRAYTLTHTRTHIHTHTHTLFPSFHQAQRHENPTNTHTPAYQNTAPLSTHTLVCYLLCAFNQPAPSSRSPHLPPSPPPAGSSKSSTRGAWPQTGWTRCTTSSSSATRRSTHTNTTCRWAAHSRKRMRANGRTRPRSPRYRRRAPSPGPRPRHSYVGLAHWARRGLHCPDRTPAVLACLGEPRRPRVAL
jgi:hypothetical protein